MLKRLFLQKSKDAILQVESAENILKSAQDRIDKLKNSNSFNLLREEIVKLIQESNYLSRDIYSSLVMQTGLAMNQKDKLGEILKQIDECLNEMEKLKNG
jgi:predicted  nucleic acid-binding Zn-ribbon protein